MHILTEPRPCEVCGRETANRLWRGKLYCRACLLTAQRTRPTIDPVAIQIIPLAVVCGVGLVLVGVALLIGGA